MATTRSSGMPASLAASSPNVGHVDHRQPRQPAITVPRPPPWRSRWPRDPCRPACGPAPVLVRRTARRDPRTPASSVRARTFEHRRGAQQGRLILLPDRGAAARTRSDRQPDSIHHDVIEQTFDTPGVGSALAVRRTWRPSGSRAARLRSSRCAGTRLAASDSAASPPPLASHRGGRAGIGVVGGPLFEDRRLHAGLPVLVQIAHHVGEPGRSRGPSPGRP